MLTPVLIIFVAHYLSLVIAIPLSDTRIPCPNIVTPLGIAHGVSNSDGVLRYSVKYGKAARWRPSSLVTAWDLPNGSNNPASLPLACPQPYIDSSSYTEDCLSMVLFVPPSINTRSRVPTLMWIHGGSFIMGSASDPALDGSKLALATNSIVAVIQYRLGAFGFLSPNPESNLAVKDAIIALKFLQKVVPSFGGSSKITIAGQSSGAAMVRALLAAPSASSLFQSAILQSEPMNFGFLRPSTQTILQNHFNSDVSCASNNIACFNRLSVPTIIAAQMDTFVSAIDLDPVAGQSEPLRPLLDGSFITSPLDLSGPFRPENKPLIISTVAQEAAGFIYTTFDQPVPEVALEPILLAHLDQSRTDAIIASPFYKPDGSGDIRPLLEEIVTDYQFRCSSWSFARSWVRSGGKAFVGEYFVGATYPSNNGISYCTQPGIVCHQDDIEIIFGTVPNPTNAQSSLISQMQKSYKNFLESGNPNGNGLPNWKPATASDVHPLRLGGSGEAPLGACTPSFWGSQVEYDYQYYNP